MVRGAGCAESRARGGALCRAALHVYIVAKTVKERAYSKNLGGGGVGGLGEEYKPGSPTLVAALRVSSTRLLSTLDCSLTI